MTTPGPVTLDLAFLRSVDGLTDLQGQEYINHRGLLALGHLHGLSSVEVTLIAFEPETGHAMVSAKVTGERGTFSDLADASPANVGPRTVNATPRMASTRAINRCLRLYLGTGSTTFEEIGPETSHQRPRRVESNGSPVTVVNPRATQTQQWDDGAAASCPSCGSGLWDNRQKRHDGWKGPSWKCKSQECIGSKGSEPWIQWDIMPTPASRPADPEPPAHSRPAPEPMDDEVPF